MCDSQDPYLLLGVARDAEMAEIKRAYRRAALACHPDRHPDDSTAAARFRRVTEAYAILSDPRRRRDFGRRRRPRPPPTAEHDAAVGDLYRSASFRRLLRQVAQDLARHGLAAGPRVLRRLLGPGSLFLLAGLFVARSRHRQVTSGSARRAGAVGRYRLPLDEGQRRRGAEVVVRLPTPGGARKVTLRIPANTAIGHRFRIPSGRGSCEVVVEVVRG